MICAAEQTAHNHRAASPSFDLEALDLQAYRLQPASSFSKIWLAMSAASTVIPLDCFVDSLPPSSTNSRCRRDNTRRLQQDSTAIAQRQYATDYSKEGLSTLVTLQLLLQADGPSTCPPLETRGNCCLGFCLSSEGAGSQRCRPSHVSQK